MRLRRFVTAWTVAAAVLGVLSSYAAADTDPAVDSRLRAMVEDDWAAQEKRLGRTAGSTESVQEALNRADRLLADLCAMAGPPDLASDAAALKRLRERSADAASLGPADRLRLYREVRWLVRDAALKNPLLAGKPVIFMKRRRFACQMLHEYVAYFAELSGVYGGSVYMLEQPGRSLKTRDLLNGRLPPGCISTLALSYDGRTVYFAQGECTGKRPVWGAYDQPRYDIFALNLDDDDLMQLTEARSDDFDPCPLPDGGIAFISSRRGGYTRCNNPWEPIPAYTLHRMDADGENLRTLSFHETNEWHPNVLHDGRIVYTRWDYVDRSASNFHGLWASNPDGSNPVSLFGNYTRRINACFEAHPIPGSHRILFVAGAHHANVGGALVIFDPARARIDPETGTDSFEAIEVLTPEVSFPEGNGHDGGWPTSYFHSPWPLSENYFLTSFGYGPIPGMSSGGKRDSTGIYYLDRFGNLELLYRDRRIASMYPILLAPRAVPPVLKSTLDPELGDEGEFLLTDVRRSNFPMPKGREIRSLRIFQVLPKTTPTVNQPRIGHANAEGARMLLGTVPVEADGSAYFRAPARKPLYFQAVGADGRAVQTMRSVTYLQAGERRGCVGCHEPLRAAPIPARTLASARPPSKIEAGPEGTRPFGYPRLVQPVLDRHCVGCHDGSTGKDKSPLVLTGQATGTFSRSYESLKPYLKWYEWGAKSIAANVTNPGQVGADQSRLTQILADATHAPKLDLSEEDRMRLFVWLDGNVPFYGTYTQAEQDAQRKGQAVPPPQVQ